MKTIPEPARDVGVVLETDVLVVGSEGIGIELEERAKALGAALPEPQSISKQVGPRGNSRGYPRL